MKQNRNKIIAREFLIFMSCITLSALVFAGTFLYNSAINFKIGKLETSITLLKKEILSLEKSITVKENNQMWFYNENEKLNANESYNNYSKLWERLEFLQKSDSIIYKWNNVWNADLKKFINKIGFKNAKDFNKFILENTLTPEELRNKSTADFINVEVYKLKRQVRRKKYKILDFGDQFQFALLCLLIIAIIIFPARYLFYSIKWSIKILRQKE